MNKLNSNVSLVTFIATNYTYGHDMGFISTKYKACFLDGINSFRENVWILFVSLVKKLLQLLGFYTAM
jgi:hypothetical protein